MMTRTFRHFTSRLVAGLALAASLSSCASISVRQGTENSGAQLPLKIYVMKFSTHEGQFNVDRKDVELSDFKKNLQKILQVAQVTDLSDRLVKAQPVTMRPVFGKHAWLIEGEFTRVNQGSRLLRTAIGFGAGGTKLETKVFVYDLSTPGTPPFLTFTTTGGSNAEPGAVTSFATDPLSLAVQMALSGASGFSHGLTEDTKRTAREITAELSDYMYRMHWVPEDARLTPKQASN